MFVDVSEIKSMKACERQWQLSSRNKYHLTNRTPNKNLRVGTLFHECLHKMYLGVPLDKVMEFLRREMDSEEDGVLLNIVPNYYHQVLFDDLDRFEVLDVEHRFEITVDEIPDLTITGSIDMIVLEKDTNTIYGFEHKTAKNYRDTSYLWMDEQPRLYSIALQQYVDKYNKDHPEQHAVVGGVYLNEVKKLLRQFQYRRTLCTYPEGDLENFMKAFIRDCKKCKHATDSTDYKAIPSPNYMNCQICNFRQVCETYMYSDVSREDILSNFEEEYMIRETDHLDEKADSKEENQLEKSSH